MTTNNSTRADDTRVRTLHELIAPNLLLEQIPLSDQASQTVLKTREQIGNIFTDQDDRLIAVVGPCSIHDPKAALEYAQLLQAFATRTAEELLIIMRVYFEKPRTTVGWKGLINDPKLDGSFDINQGLYTARHLLLDINNLGLATGSEFLDTIIPQYLSDLSSWAAIGARTCESQVHRELASGLSMPVGFKNGTSGDVQIAVDAVTAAKQPHHFLGINKHGLASIVATQGNEFCHPILRGAKSGPNYQAEHVNDTVKRLSAKRLTPKVMIDCSHGNSNKDHTRQALVGRDVAAQIAAGSQHILGVMLESNLVAGQQQLQTNKTLVYGQSITDACMDWEKTAFVLNQLAEAVKKRRAHRRVLV